MDREKLATHEMIFTDCLNRQKHLTDTYNRAALESSNPQLRGVFGEIHREEMQNAERLFREMRNRGWYSPEIATDKEIERAQQSFHVRRTRR